MKDKLLITGGGIPFASNDADLTIENDKIKSDKRRKNYGLCRISL